MRNSKNHTILFLQLKNLFVRLIDFSFKLLIYLFNHLIIEWLNKFNE